MTDPDFMLIPRPKDPLDAAIRYFGTAKDLAEALGYTNSAVTLWRKRGQVPDFTARAIDQLTNGQCPAASFDCKLEPR